MGNFFFSFFSTVFISIYSTRTIMMHLQEDGWVFKGLVIEGLWLIRDPTALLVFRHVRGHFMAA